MLHRLLQDYLSEIETAVSELTITNVAYIENYEEEIVTPDRINLRLRIRFFEGVLLAINEALIVDGTSLAHLDYRYHCQNAENTLIFRYDNTPHFPDLPTFPHHKHIGKEAVASDKPLLVNVLLEARQASQGNAV